MNDPLLTPETPLDLEWVRYASKTDPGQTRDHNEDWVLVQPWPDRSALLAVVADGMGGHRGGEVAAQIAIETFRELVDQSLPSDSAECYERLAQCFHLADQRIREQASQSFKLMDMGTTIVAALIWPTQYLYLHAGDCRLYHFSAHGEPIRRSQDHSVMQVLLDLGQITEEQIPYHPMRSVVNSCLGGRGDKGFSIDPQWSDEDPPIYPWQPGDLLLLSSDGFHGAISSDQVLELIGQSLCDPMHFCERGVEAANGAGGHDNISVIAMVCERKDDSGCR